VPQVWSLIQSKSGEQKVDVNFIELMRSTSDAVGNLVSEVYDQPKPWLFYRYTSKLREFVNSQCLWSTSLENQKDRSELIHGLQWLDEAMRSGAIATNEFTRAVLNRLPRLIRERRKWMFITCFCADAGSNAHQTRYGTQFLKLTRDELIRLRCKDPEATMWLQPVIYREDVQKAAIKKAIDSLVMCLERQSVSGPMEGCDQWLATDCATNMAIILLRLLSGFKQVEYADENEWRMVTYPEMILGYTAQSDLENNFRIATSEKPRPHSELEPTELVGFLP
jgi:hypothetical protein